MRKKRNSDSRPSGKPSKPGAPKKKSGASKKKSSTGPRGGASRDARAKSRKAPAASRKPAAGKKPAAGRAPAASRKPAASKSPGAKKRTAETSRRARDTGGKSSHKSHNKDARRGTRTEQSRSPRGKRPPARGRARDERHDRDRDRPRSGAKRVPAGAGHPAKKTVKPESETAAKSTPKKKVAKKKITGIRKKPAPPTPGETVQRLRDSISGKKSPTPGKESFADPDEDFAAKPDSYRINRYLAQAGYGSRREVEQFILDGRVKVNGRKVETLDVRVKEGDLVEMDGNIVSLPDAPLYYALNKPRGYVVSKREFPDQPTIYRLLPDELQNLRYAGRLDLESRGLLLLSNDGAFIQAVSHPARRITKRYLVQVDELPTETELRQAFFRGIDDGGELLRALRLLVRDREKGLVEVVLAQGRNRQLRRMFAALNIKVLDLYREAVGFLDLAKTPIEEGKFVPFQPEQVFFGQRSAPTFDPRAGS